MNILEYLQVHPNTYKRHTYPQILCSHTSHIHQHSPLSWHVNIVHAKLETNQKQKMNIDEIFEGNERNIIPDDKYREGK